MAVLVSPTIWLALLICVWMCFSKFRCRSIVTLISFSIYINDLPECVKSDVFLFADDMTIFREIKDDSDASIIQSDLNELFKWSETWLLKFHLFRNLDVDLS
jgi:hypothetical protein